MQGRRKHGSLLAQLATRASASGSAVFGSNAQVAAMAHLLADSQTHCFRFLANLARRLGPPGSDQLDDANAGAAGAAAPIALSPGAASALLRLTRSPSALEGVECATGNMPAMRHAARVMTWSATALLRALLTDDCAAAKGLHDVRPAAAILSLLQAHDKARSPHIFLCVTLHKAAR